MENIYITMESLLDFVMEAKQKSYAKNLLIKPPKINGSREYVYKRGAWSYQDNYSGSFIDGGMELIRFENHPIWMMGYRGGILNSSQYTSSQNIFAFLKKALLLCPKEIPARGPEEFSQDRFSYKNEIHGSILNFSGKESIFLDGSIVYKKRYIGGILQGRLYRVSIK